MKRHYLYVLNIFLFISCALSVINSLQAQEFTFTQKWVKSRNTGNFITIGTEARCMAYYNDTLYFGDRLAPHNKMRLYSAQTGNFVRALILNDVTDNLGNNTVRTDEAGNIILANLTLDARTAPFHVWKMVNANVKPSLIINYTDIAATKAIRIDYANIYGDVNGDGYIIAAVNGTGTQEQDKTVLKWVITNGIVSTVPEKIILQDYFPQSLTSNGATPHIFPVDARSFYFDGASSFPTLYGSNSTKLVIDLSDVSGKSIKNINSDHVVMNYQNTWLAKAAIQPANYFRDNYPFVEHVHFICATGGNVQRDLFVDPNNRTVLDDYDFSNLIKGLKNVVRQGLKPMIKTGMVPFKYSENPEMGDFGMNKRPPSDYNVYYNYIKALAQAVVQEYGIDEVKTWSWGVLTEYENKQWFSTSDGSSAATKVAFCKLYDYTVAALEDVIGADNLFVGAHSMTVSDSNAMFDERDFINHVATGTNYKTGRKGTQIDFLSVSYYEESPGVMQQGQRNLTETIRFVKDYAISKGLTNLKYGIDEGRILAGPESDIRRSLRTRVVAHTFQASADARLFRIMTDLEADWVADWGYSTNGIWGGIPSVSTQLFKLLHKMKGSQRLGLVLKDDSNSTKQEINGVSSFDEATNTMYVLAYNYMANLNAKDSSEIEVQISNIKAVNGNTVTINKWIIDDSHGNFWPTWYQDMINQGISDSSFEWSKYSVDVTNNLINTSALQYWKTRESTYMQLADLNSTITTGTIENNNLLLKHKMDHHAVVFYEITNVLRSN
ncbi:MAG: hypothetical protein VB102_10445 [Paludibacter sp.]|nr:hypothetical protein [Paludibacter sp.]